MAGGSCLGFDLLRDFVPIGRLSRFSFFSGKNIPWMVSGSFLNSNSSGDELRQTFSWTTRSLSVGRTSLVKPRPLRRSRVRRIFREKRKCCLSRAESGASSFSRRKKRLREVSHACGMAKLRDTVLLVLFLPPRKVREEMR